MKFGLHSDTAHSGIVRRVYRKRDGGDYMVHK
jgi:hypothetical protein